MIGHYLCLLALLQYSLPEQCITLSSVVVVPLINLAKAMAMASANVLLLPEAGSGHLMSLIEAGKRLLAHGGRGDGEGPR